MALSEERKDEILEEEVIRRGVKDPGIAALLSFLFNGLGQMYNGQILKGLNIMMLSVLTMIAVLVVGIYLFTIFWKNTPETFNLWLALGLFGISILSVAVIGIYSIYDAVKVARIKNSCRKKFN